MRHLLYVIPIIFCLALVGCRTTKKVTSEKTVIKQEITKDTTTVSVISRKSEINKNSLHLDSIFRNATLSFEIYDTEKIDSAGTAPVKMRGVWLITENAVSKTDSIISITSFSVDSLEEKKAERTEYQDIQEKREEKETESDKDFLLKIGIAIAFLMIIIVIKAR